MSSLSNWLEYSTGENTEDLIYAHKHYPDLLLDLVELGMRGEWNVPVEKYVEAFNAMKKVAYWKEDYKPILILEKWELEKLVEIYKKKRGGE
jgi:hypothetical protein